MACTQSAFVHYCSVYSTISRKDFGTLSKLIGIKGTRDTRQYLMVPREKNISAQKLDINTPSSPTPIYTEFILFNANRLITNSINKCQTILDSIDRRRNFILCITETWLKEQMHLQGELDTYLAEYHVTRCDRDLNLGIKADGGGCITITSNNLPSREALKYSNGICELLITEVEVLNLYVCNLYRPSSATAAQFKDVIKRVAKFLDKEEQHNPNIIIAGDFNFPKDNITWEVENDVVVPIIHQKHKSLEELLSFADSLFLTQIITKPTRNESTLDLVFTNDPHSFLSTACLPSSVSDHKLVYNTTAYTVNNLPTEQNPIALPKIATFQFEDFDNNEFDEALATALSNINPTDDMGPADILQAMEKATVELAEKFKVPTSESSKPRINLPPAHRRKLFRKRSLLRTRLAKLPHLKDDLEPAILCIDQEIQESYKAQQVLSEKKAVDAIKTNSKSFFKYAQSKRQGKTKIGPLKTTSLGSTTTTKPQTP